MASRTLQVGDVVVLRDGAPSWIMKTPTHLNCELARRDLEKEPPPIRPAVVDRIDKIIVTRVEKVAWSGGGRRPRGLTEGLSINHGRLIYFRAEDVTQAESEDPPGTKKRRPATKKRAPKQES